MAIDERLDEQARDRLQTRGRIPSDEEGPGQNYQHFRTYDPRERIVTPRYERAMLTLPQRHPRIYQVYQSLTAFFS